MKFIKCVMSAALCCLTLTQVNGQDLIFSLSGGAGDEIRVVGADGTDKGALVSPTTGSSPFGLGQAGPGNSIFWTDILDDVIYRSDAMGNGESVAFSTIFDGDSGATVQSISVDTANRRIFWGDSTNDAIRVANFDGTGGTTLYTDSSNAGSPNGVFYDSFGNRVLWGDNTGDAIMAFDLDTSTVERLIDLDADIADGSYVPKDVFATDTNIYFVDSGPDKLWQADADGSNIVELVDFSDFYAANGNFGDTDSSTVTNGMTVVNDVVYWSEGNGGKRGIYGYDLGTGTAFRLLDTQSINSGAAPLKLAVFNAVPEPTSVSILSLFGLGISLRRRRG